MSFKNTVTDGLLRRLCIGPTVMNENGGDRCQGGDCNAGLDEVAVYNYAMSDAEIAWLTTHEVALPPLAVTALARTVSADGAWAGTATDWTLNGTSRKIVWPAGEDAGAAATLTVAGEVAVTVDTLVHVTNLVFAGEGALALSVAPNCRLASPEELTVGKGLSVTLPAGMALSGTVRGAGALAGAGSLAGTWKIDALDGADAGWLSWPADTDFSSTTIDVAVEKGRLAEYTLVKGFTGKLPKKVLHQGEEDGVFVVSVIGGDLVLRNKDKCGMRIFVR